MDKHRCDLISEPDTFGLINRTHTHSHRSDDPALWGLYSAHWGPYQTGPHTLLSLPVTPRLDEDLKAGHADAMEKDLRDLTLSMGRLSPPVRATGPGSPHPLGD